VDRFFEDDATNSPKARSKKVPMQLELKNWIAGC
jgi:hypothetical protein